MYSDKQKAMLRELYLSGVSVSDISRQLNIPKSTIYRWLHQFDLLKSSSETVTTQNDYNHLLKRTKRLEEENQIFKLSNCTQSAPLEQRLNEIKRLRDQFSIHALCNVLNVRRSTFYHFLYRRPEITKIERDDLLYRERIADIFERSEQRFGAKKIEAKLDEEGHRLGNKRIQRLMNEMGLKCNRDKPVRKYMPETSKQYYRNKLNREFNQVLPNTAWVSDITYCTAAQKKCYICVIIDLFSRKVLASEVSTSISSSMVAEEEYHWFSFISYMEI
jgi:transposase-like protein